MVGVRVHRARSGRTPTSRFIRHRKDRECCSLRPEAQRSELGVIVGLLSPNSTPPHCDHSRSSGGGAESSPVVWIPDEVVDACMACRTGFDFFNRKHHCRGCGRIFCHNCSSQKSLLPPEFGTRDPQRVCQQCYRDLLPFQKDLIETVSNQMKVNEIDQTGARRYFSSPLTFTLGHAIRNAAYSLENQVTGDIIADQHVPAALLQVCACGDVM